MTPVGCAVGPPITGQFNLEGIPVLGLVDTGASVTCMGFSVWWQYPAQWGPLKPFERVVHGAHGKPLQIAWKTQHLNLQWGEARGWACFIVIISLESPPVLIEMNIMRPLSVRIDVTNGTATPSQPDPQTIHLTAPQKQDPHPTSRALLLQTTDIPAETACLVRCHNPWPNEDVYFCPEEALLTFVSRVPALSSGSKVWVAIHNHRPEPLRLHAGQNVGTLEIVVLADSLPPLPPIQQQQLKDLFQEFSDIISQGEDNLGCTPLLQHTIETKGPPLHQPYRRQDPAVRREEMAQVQQMLMSGVIRPSNSPWSSPMVMVKKKDGSLRFCVDFWQPNAATIEDSHPFLASTASSTPYMGLAGFPLLILGVDTGKSLSRSGTRKRRLFVLAVASSSNLTKSPLASATLPPPTPASWIASSPVFTGKRASSISTISSCSPPHGKSTLPTSVKSSSDYDTPS